MRYDNNKLKDISKSNWHITIQGRHVTLMRNRTFTSSKESHMTIIKSIPHIHTTTTTTQHVETNSPDTHLHLVKTSTCSGEETIEGVVRYDNNKLKDINKIKLACNNQLSPWGWCQYNNYKPYPHFPNLMSSRQQPNELTILIPTQLKLTHLKPTHLLCITQLVMI